MIFLPGLSGQYIAIADSEEEAQALRPLAEACLKVCVLTDSCRTRKTGSLAAVRALACVHATDERLTCPQKRISFHRILPATN